MAPPADELERLAERHSDIARDPGLAGERRTTDE